MSISSAVLITGFNRPEHTKKVLDRTLEAGVQKIYLAVDGPRSEVKTDEEATEGVRNLASVAGNKAEVVELFQEENLGCRAAMRSALTTFFHNEPQGIVLEDDCLPHRFFFTYCETMLERFDGSNDVGLVTGHNRLGDTLGWAGDYFFSLFGGIWGWASWSNVWLAHMEKPNSIDNIKLEELEEALGSKMLGYLRLRELKAYRESSARGSVNSWDYEFGAFRHLSHLKAVVPARNLIENIGRGAGGTHTKRGKVLNPSLTRSATLTASKQIGDSSRPLRLYDFAWMLPGF